MVWGMYCLTLDLPTYQLYCKSFNINTITFLLFIFAAWKSIKRKPISHTTCSVSSPIE